MSITLMDRLRSYPGGVAALSKKTGVSATQLYAFGKGEHRRIPWGIVFLVAPVLDLDTDALAQAWQRAADGVTA